MNILTESMTRLTWRGFTIRIWRQEADTETTPENDDLKKLLESICELPPVVVAKLLIKMDRVNAVEILGSDGTGTVLYRDWP